MVLSMVLSKVFIMVFSKVLKVSAEYRVPCFFGRTILRAGCMVFARFLKVSAKPCVVCHVAP